MAINLVQLLSFSAHIVGIVGNTQAFMQGGNPLDVFSHIQTTRELILPTGVLLIEVKTFSPSITFVTT